MFCCFELGSGADLQKLGQDCLCMCLFLELGMGADLQNLGQDCLCM